MAVGLDFHFAEVGLDFAALGPRLHGEVRLGGDREMDLALAVLDLDGAQGQLGGVHFNFAVGVLDLHVARDIVEVNVFRARHDAERPGERVRAQLAQVHRHFAFELAEVHVGAR